MHQVRGRSYPVEYFLISVKAALQEVVAGFGSMFYALHLYTSERTISCGASVSGLIAAKTEPTCPIETQEINGYHVCMADRIGSLSPWTGQGKESDLTKTG